MEPDERIAALRRHVGDLLALERHILEAVGRQHGSARLAELPEAGTTITAIERLLARQVDALEHYQRGFAGDGAARASGGIKQAVTRFAGALAGLYDRIREHEVSRMLRDDYTALSLLAISCEMMHTMALALREPNLARIALAHLQELTPLITELARIVPQVVATELGGDPGVAAEAQRNAREAFTTPS
jgi:hypothetical protein